MIYLTGDWTTLPCLLIRYEGVGSDSAFAFARTEGVTTWHTSALQSWLHGNLVRTFSPETVALHSSRGIETEPSKTLLRWSVVLTDLLGAPITIQSFIPVSINCIILDSPVFFRRAHADQ